MYYTEMGLFWKYRTIKTKHRRKHRLGWIESVYDKYSDICHWRPLVSPVTSERTALMHRIIPFSARLVVVVFSGVVVVVPVGM